MSVRSAGRGRMRRKRHEQEDEAALALACRLAAGSAPPAVRTGSPLRTPAAGQAGRSPPPQVIQASELAEMLHVAATSGVSLQTPEFPPEGTHVAPSPPHTLAVPQNAVLTVGSRREVAPAEPHGSPHRDPALPLEISHPRLVTRVTSPLIQALRRSRSPPRPPSASPRTQTPGRGYDSDEFGRTVLGSSTVQRRLYNEELGTTTAHLPPETGRRYNENELGFTTRRPSDMLPPSPRRVTVPPSPRAPEARARRYNEHELGFTTRRFDASHGATVFRSNDWNAHPSDLTSRITRSTVSFDLRGDEKTGEGRDRLYKESEMGTTVARSGPSEGWLSPRAPEPLVILGGEKVTFDDNPTSATLPLNVDTPLKFKDVVPSIPPAQEGDEEARSAAVPDPPGELRRTLTGLNSPPRGPSTDSDGSKCSACPSHAREVWSRVPVLWQRVVLVIIVLVLLGLLIFAAVCAAALARDPPQQPSCWSGGTQYVLTTELSTLGGVRLLNLRSVVTAPSWCSGCVAVTQAPNADGKSIIPESVVVIGDVGSSSAVVSADAPPFSMGQSTFVAPLRSAVDSAGYVWVPDASLSQAIRLERTAAAPRRVGRSVGVMASAGSEAGRLNRPVAAAVGPNGELALADVGNCRVVLFSPLASWNTSVGGCGAAVDLGGVVDIAYAESGPLHVADQERVWEVDAAAASATEVFSAEPPSGRLDKLARSLRSESWDIVSLAAAPGHQGYMLTLEGSQVLIRNQDSVVCRFGDFSRPRGAAMLPDKRVVVAEADRLLVYSSQ
eukprot:Hpha_TRINITY_DN22981_c0_g1::TRINITY_DN22981_c0_g1_i1::g.154041::m.154041